MNNLLFEYLPNKDHRTLTIRREFLADRAKVWDYYTKSELLEQWFAPQPMHMRTKLMNFREGGRWHYAMAEPNGPVYWGLTQYKTIRPQAELSFSDAFCDEEARINTEIPSADWTITFTTEGEKTLVQSVLTFKSLSDLEQILEMGMEDGMKATYATLDHLLV